MSQYSDPQHWGPNGWKGWPHTWGQFALGFVLLWIGLPLAIYGLTLGIQYLTGKR